MIREASLLVKIHHLIEAINNNEVEFKTGHMTMEFISSLVTSDRVCESTINNMPDYRRDQPLIYTYIADQGRIIDGNHRLAKRISDGYPSCEVIAVDPEVLLKFCEELGF